MVKAPLWGTMQPGDYSWRQRMSDVLRGVMDSTHANLRRDFVPQWDCLMDKIFTGSLGNQNDLSGVAASFSIQRGTDKHVSCFVNIFYLDGVRQNIIYPRALSLRLKDSL